MSEIRDPGIPSAGKMPKNTSVTYLNELKNAGKFRKLINLIN